MLTSRSISSVIIHFIFITFFIVFAYAKIIRVGKHFNAFFSIVDSNSRLTRSCVGNFTKVTKKDCVAHCIKDNRCSTFNYNCKEKICEILNVSKFDGVGYLERQKHWTHYETDCNNNKIGPICNAGDLCKPFQICEDTFNETKYICRCRDGFTGRGCETYAGPGSTKGNPAPSCSLLLGKYTSFPCGNYWLKKGTLVRQKFCRNTDTLYRWPEGEYGILSRNSCPPNWFEFTHCINAEKTPTHTLEVTKSKLDLGSCGITESSMTFRYCFKGPNVPSRPGGFWTKSGNVGNAFVMKNVNNECSIYGNDGGEILMDIDDGEPPIYGNNGLNNVYYPDYYPQGYSFSNNMELTFCLIGQKHTSSTCDRLLIGEFNQMFGLFSYPDNATCPVLESPNGILHATRETIIIDLESSGSVSSIVNGRPPFVIDVNLDGVFGICVYDPSTEQIN